MRKEFKTIIASIVIAVSFFAFGVFYQVLEPLAQAALTRTHNWIAGTKILSSEVNFDVNQLFGAIGTQVYTQKNHIATDQTVTASLDAIDIAIGTLHYSGTSVITTDQVITASLQALDYKFGGWTFTEHNYIHTSDNLTTALDNLDMQIKDNTDLISTYSFTPRYFKQKLRIYPASSAVSPYQVTVEVDELTLTDNSGAKVIVENINRTIAIQTSGSGGLDTGSESGSTVYYVWMARSGTTTQVAGFFSLSATAPTLPAIFTYKRLVGEVYNDAASNLLGATRFDDRVTFADPIVIYNDQTLFNGTQNNYKTYALPAPVSLLATTVGAVTALDLEAGAVGLNRNIQVISGTTLPVSQQWTTANYSDTGSFVGPTGLYNVLRILWPYNGSGYVYAKANLNSGNYAHQSLYLWGYVLPR